MDWVRDQFMTSCCDRSANLTRNYRNHVYVSTSLCDHKFGTCAHMCPHLCAHGSMCPRLYVSQFSRLGLSPPSPQYHSHHHHRPAPTSPPLVSPNIDENLGGGSHIRVLGESGTAISHKKCKSCNHRYPTHCVNITAM